MRVPLLRAADEAFLHRGRPFGVDNHRRAVDPLPLEFVAELAAVGIVADHAGEAHVGLQAAEHVGDVRRSAQAHLAAALAEQNHRGFLADALGVTPGVAIKNQIAQHQDPRTAQVLDEINQMIGHGLHSLVVSLREASVAPPEGERPVRVPVASHGCGRFQV